jgi:8-oxo-dGTP pyrophosphatase MutT (NUDIX family)
MRRAFSVSGYVVFEQRALLVCHIKQNAWVPIGGEIEAGETPLEALKREVSEEIGWHYRQDYTLPSPTDPGSPPGLFCYEEHDARSKGLHMNFAFLLLGRHDSISTIGGAAFISSPKDFQPPEFTGHQWVQDATEVNPVPPNVQHLVTKALQLAKASV